jgi:hypothetical protein
MQLNFMTWLSSLNHFSAGQTLEGATLMFPLLDRASKNRYPNFGNKKRMTLFLKDELEKVIALGTGLDLTFRQDGPKILFDTEHIGEVLYRLRCFLLHESEFPSDIEFTRNSGQFSFGWTKPTGASSATITLPDQFCECLLLVLLGCPEYKTLPLEFRGRKIRFGRHEILPSTCVGQFGILRQQLLFGAELD